MYACIKDPLSVHSFCVCMRVSVCVFGHFHSFVCLIRFLGIRPLWFVTEDWRLTGGGKFVLHLHFPCLQYVGLCLHVETLIEEEKPLLMCLSVIISYLMVNLSVQKLTSSFNTNVDGFVILEYVLTDTGQILLN